MYSIYTNIYTNMEYLIIILLLISNYYTGKTIYYNNKWSQLTTHK